MSSQEKFQTSGLLPLEVHKLLLRCSADFDWCGKAVEKLLVSCDSFVTTEVHGSRVDTM